MNAKLFSTLLAGIAFVTLGQGPAQAGFQWTAPTGETAARVPAPQGNTQARAPRVQASPVAPVVSENLPESLSAIPSSPIPTTPDGPAVAAPVYTPGSSDDPISWNQPHSARPPVEASSVPQSTLPRQQAIAPAAAPTPLYTPPADVITPAAPVAAAPAAVQTGNFAVAEGFGSDLPLVMAIRQIVPSSFGFVFDDGINLSTNVSWQGGQPWNVVLQNVLTPLQLHAAISGNVVSIVPANKTGAIQNANHTGAAMVTSEAVLQNGNGAVNASAPVIAQPAVIQAPTHIPGPVLASATKPDLHAKTTWVAPRNSTLRGILEDWSKRMGVELYWASEYDYPVQSAVSIDGSFEEAVQVLLRGLSESKPRPLGRLHPNLPNGPAVLLIETRESSM